MECLKNSKVKRLVVFILAAAMVFGTFNLELGGAGGVKADDYPFTISAGPGGTEQKFDYESAYYDNGDNALFDVTVTPQVDESLYEIGFSKEVGNMQWTIYGIQPIGEDYTVLQFRGNTMAFGNPDEGTMSIVIRDKATNEIVGKLDIHMTFYSSANRFTVSWDGNGGYVNANKDETYASQVKEGSYIELPDEIAPEYKDDSKTFVGWQIDGAGTIYYNKKTAPNTPVVSDIKPTGDITLVALWEDAISVKFDTAGNGKLKSYSSANSKLVSESETAVEYICPRVRLADVSLKQKLMVRYLQVGRAV